MAYPVYTSGPYYNKGYSGTFIPEIWSAKLNAKFYKATVFGEIANTDWEGDISSVGDKVIINNVPSIAITDYEVGGTLSYEVPTPNTVELLIDQGLSFAFQVNDVLTMQSKPNLVDTFTGDATNRMKIHIDADVIWRSLFSYDSSVTDKVVLSGPAAANTGATAGVRSLGYNLGTLTAGIDLLSGGGNATLDVILRMAAVLDEQDVPDDGRWLVIDPLTRNLLMGTPLAQANLMGDPKSMVRNGKIGMIDRFTVYVSNNLPRAAAATEWVDGLTATNAGYTYDAKDADSAYLETLDARRVIVAGHKSAISFASQMTKVETLRIQDDFGDYIRGLNVYGSKVVKPEALTVAFLES